jgi:hypothetical protein
MPARAFVAALCGLLAGCGAGSMATSEDANVASSLQYDGVACRQLIAERNELATRHGLSRDARPVFATAPAGFGTVIPDTRSADRRATDQAAGQVDAMNRSLVRRGCIPKPEAG